MPNKRKEAIKGLQESSAILDKMFNDSSLNELLYYRAIIKLAEEYSAIDLCDRAMILLLKIPRSYYRDHFIDDLNNSEEFLLQASNLVKRLKVAGYAVDNIKINMMAAKA